MPRVGTSFIVMPGGNIEDETRRQLEVLQRHYGTLRDVQIRDNPDERGVVTRHIQADSDDLFADANNLGRSYVQTAREQRARERPFFEPVYMARPTDADEEYVRSRSPTMRDLDYIRRDYQRQIEDERRRTQEVGAERDSLRASNERLIATLEDIINHEEFTCKSCQVLVSIAEKALERVDKMRI